MTTDRPSGDGPALEWFRSSYGTNDGPECAEAASAPETVRVRDSKHMPGPRLTFSPHRWTAFLPYASGRR